MTEGDKKRRKPPAVYALSRQSRCYNCDSRLEKDDIVKLEEGKDEREVLCAKCAGLSDFVVVPSGNAKVTRLATKYSPAYCVIMKWSELWKCYERRGLLVEEAAVRQIETDLGITLQRQKQPN